MSELSIAQLGLNIGDRAAVNKDGLIQVDGAITISDLEFVLRESKLFCRYKGQRMISYLLDVFPEVPDKPPAHIIAKIDQLMDELPDEEPLKLAEPEPMDAEASTDDIKLVSTWGMKCGIATYTGYLYDAIKKIDSQFPLGIHPIRGEESFDNVEGRIVHYQHEYGIIPRAPKSRSKAIVTFHSVFPDMRPTLEQYEKNLNIVAYVAHFKEGYDILSASTKKDVWLIPHGSKIIRSKRTLSEDHFKDYIKNLLGLEDVPHAFMFGFQSDNKDYDMVTKACENAGINLIINGAINDHVHAYYKGNIGCNRKNVEVLGKYLSEIEVDLYALASDILIFHASELVNYSCSGAMHRVVGAGRPVICNRVKHYVDIVEGEDCLKYDDSEELQQKIMEALEHREEFGEKAREYAKRTSWEIVARKHMEMYQKYGGI